ncbi:MAG: glucose-6-phosphate isomerase, partial [Bacilli bacterium]|nr:glucose-6-phosphate isomerase [Bacilli bacterium]
YMKENFSDYKERIIITTSVNHGKLKDFAIQEGLKILSVPEQIGGRYSVFTSVGLLPIAVSGIDIHQLLEGAKSERNCFDSSKEYALVRKHLEESGRVIEAVTFYEEKLSSVVSWIQQVLAETQGKEGKGILPIINPNTTNLHSIGQYFQEGRPIIFETVIQIEKMEDIFLEEYHISMNEMNHLVLNQVAIAHKQAALPSIIITLKDLTPYEIGKLLYFFQMSAAIGGYLLEVDPFNQPGVEAYKQLVNQELSKRNQEENHG